MDKKDKKTVELKVITEEEREKLRIPSYEYILP